MTQHDEPDVTGNDTTGYDTTPGEDLHQTSTLAVRNPYDAPVPETLRERLAYAKALAQAGILPRDYAGRPANVLVAGEMGRELGLSTVQSVLMLNVVEGRPSLGANGVRAVVLAAGHRMSSAELTYSKHGVPVEARVTGQRMRYGDDPAGRLEPDGDPVTIVWNVARAHRAGLCRVKRDDAGEVTEVTARSSGGKVLPWEAYTEDMLDARATTKLGRTLFADCTMGLSYERDELEAQPTLVTAEQVTAPTAPTARAAEALTKITPTRRTDLADDYTPDADLAEAGPTWWEHAGAQVSRRSKVQLAADRIARWVADADPETLSNFPVPDVVDAEVVEDAPAEGEGAPDAAADDMPADPEPVDQAPEDAEPEVPDPHDGSDPWATPTPEDEQPADAEPEVAEPGDTTPADALPDDGPSLDDGPDDAAADLAPELTTPALLEAIDAVAAELGKTRQGLMVRWIASHRKNPEDATPDELLPFLEQAEALAASKR